MKRLVLGIIMILGGILSQVNVAHAASVGNDVVSLVTAAGCQGPSTCYFGIANNPLKCLYGLIYFDVSNFAGKGQYAAVLSALALNKSVAVHYDQANNGICSNVAYMHVLK